MVANPINSWSEVTPAVSITHVYCAAKRILVALGRADNYLKIRGKENQMKCAAAPLTAADATIRIVEGR